MKKSNNFFKKSNLLTMTIALMFALSSTIFTPITAYAVSYNDYWSDSDVDWDDYWEDSDYDWEDYGYDCQRSNSSGYYKLKSNSKSNYFSDIKGTKYAKYIDWCGRKGLLVGIGKKGKKIYPTQTVQKRQLHLMLKNRWGNDIDLKVGNSKAKVSQKYFCETTSSVTKQLGYNLSWNDVTKNAKMDLGEVCYSTYWMLKTANGKI